MTLQFNTPIQNNPGNPFGLDFIIFGHAGFIEDFSTGTAVDGSLYTGGTSDVRVSVSADGTTFYTLNPALTPQVDGLFPTDGSGNPFLPVNPALTAADFAGQDLAGIRALYNGSAGGAGFSLAWAIDANGQSVSLSSVDYVRLEVLNDGTPAYIDAISVVPEPATVDVGLDRCRVVLTATARLITCASVCSFCGAWLPPRPAGRQPLKRIFPATRCRTAGKSSATPTCSNGMPPIKTSMSPGIRRKPTVIFIIHSERLSPKRTTSVSAFDLNFRISPVGVNPDKPYDFEVVVGFHQSRQRHAIPILSAASASMPPTAPANLVEFDYLS